MSSVPHRPIKPFHPIEGTKDDVYYRNIIGKLWVNAPVEKGKEAAFFDGLRVRYNLDPVYMETIIISLNGTKDATP